MKRRPHAVLIRTLVISVICAAGVLALLIKALISMYKKAPKNFVAYFIMAASFAAVAFFSANVIIVILSAALIGIAATLIARKAGKTL